MSRPKKQTVDYFPHDCAPSKYLFIVEQRFGNDGYAAWYKTLEQLGRSEGHFIDCRMQLTFEFLQSVIRVSSDRLREILDLMAALEFIDKDLWKEDVIWSQTFVDGISEVYRNRRVEIPSRPELHSPKSCSIEITTIENPQTKLKNRNEEKREFQKTNHTHIESESLRTSEYSATDKQLDHLLNPKLSGKKLVQINSRVLPPEMDQVVVLFQYYLDEYEKAFKTKPPKLPTMSKYVDIRDEIDRIGLEELKRRLLCYFKDQQKARAIWRLEYFLAVHTEYDEKIIELKALSDHRKSINVLDKNMEAAKRWLSKE